MKKMDLETRNRFISQLFNLFMSEDIYDNWEEFICYMGEKMSIYSVKWEDLYDVVPDNIADDYVDIKDYFESLVNNMAVTKDKFFYAIDTCLDFSKSINPY